LLKDDDRRVHWSAISALTFMRMKESMPVLREMLVENRSKYVSHIVRALSAIGGVDALNKTLQDERIYNNRNALFFIKKDMMLLGVSQDEARNACDPRASKWKNVASQNTKTFEIAPSQTKPVRPPHDRRGVLRQPKLPAHSSRWWTDSRLVQYRNIKVRSCEASVLRKLRSGILFIVPENRVYKPISLYINDKPTPLIGYQPEKRSRRILGDKNRYASQKTLRGHLLPPEINASATHAGVSGEYMVSRWSLKPDKYKLKLSQEGFPDAEFEVIVSFGCVSPIVVKSIPAVYKTIFATKEFETLERARVWIDSQGFHQGTRTGIGRGKTIVTYPTKEKKVTPSKLVAEKLPPQAARGLTSIPGGSCALSDGARELLAPLIGALVRADVYGHVWQVNLNKNRKSLFYRTPTMDALLRLKTKDTALRLVQTTKLSAPPLWAKSYLNCYEELLNSPEGVKPKDLPVSVSQELRTFIDTSRKKTLEDINKADTQGPPLSSLLDRKWDGVATDLQKMGASAYWRQTKEKGLDTKSFYGPGTLRAKIGINDGVVKYVTSETARGWGKSFGSVHADLSPGREASAAIAQLGPPEINWRSGFYIEESSRFGIMIWVLGDVCLIADIMGGTIYRVTCCTSDVTDFDTELKVRLQKAHAPGKSIRKLLPKLR